MLTVHSQKALHLRKTSSSSRVFVIRAQFGLITKPLCEKTRSTGAELCSFIHLLYQIKFIKAMRLRHMRTRPILHEAEAKTYEAKATKFGLEATLASRT